MAREVRVSPDGEATAIRSDKPVDSDEAYGVIHATNGGAWVPLTQVDDWTIVSEGV